LAYQDLLAKIEKRTARAGVIGMGYVGLPLAMAICRAGFPVVGLDIDAVKVAHLNEGKSYIDAVSSDVLAEHVSKNNFVASSDMAQIGSCDVVIICVPTPLSRNREPDLTYVVKTSESIAEHMKAGTLVVLESTTYPGTTTDVVLPILKSRFADTNSFFLGYSPEREDPGNRQFNTTSIPKIVAGEDAQSGVLTARFYASIVDRVVPVSTTATAEAVKIMENTFRAVNIALVNELKVVYDAMGIDIWEVIEAAKTKPFGFQAFYPGPGLGGHCIPIDPFYLTWKAREFEIQTRFIELAGEINTAMPRYVISRLEEALGNHVGKPLSRSRILILGLAYKKNVPDMRESPTFKLMELLERRGAEFDYHDPLVPVIGPTREHSAYQGLLSIALSPKTVSQYDAVLLSTDHDALDYEMIAGATKLIIDTRNRFQDFAREGLVILKA
jgi:UDP-N-acetyl-D-glucosamine dehydrogenase